MRSFTYRNHKNAAVADPWNIGEYIFTHYLTFEAWISEQTSMGILKDV